MSTPARNTLAIIGAGPISLEAACAGLDAGLDVHVFERGEVGSHPIAWGHVRMFTPWRMNLGPRSTERLVASGWTPPPAGECPTGLELAERYLQPLSALADLKPRIHTHAQVVHVSRRGALKGDSGPARREHPFRLLVRDQGGRENFIHAFSVIDASGVYGQPNWAGDGGIPARSELYLAPQISYHLDDVLGLRRERYAGKRVMVVGAGHTAATVVAQLVLLAAEDPSTRVVWVTRKPASQLYAATAGDTLPERASLNSTARAFLGGSNPAVTHIGPAVVEGFEFNSATHQYRVNLMLGDQPRLEQVDQVVVNAGFGPDNSIYRELQVHECYASRGPMNLASALLGAGTSDCTQVPAFGVDILRNPEPDFFILGNKSYGRGSSFLLETGYKQVAEVIAPLAKDVPVPTRTS